ncbi:hypothetical protein ABK040_006410 [Willaertia magna]
MMQQQDPTLQNIVKAIEIIHNPSSLQQSRVEAQQYIEDFKLNNPNKLEYSLTLITTNFPDPIRHFALQVIDHVVSKEWTTGGTSSNYQEFQRKSQLTNTLLDYAARGTRHLLEEKNFIKEKLAEILSTIIVKTWPKLIPDVYENVIKLMGMGETSCEIGILTLKTLAQELLPEFSNELSNEKRKELLESLQPKVPDFFSKCFQLFDTTFGSLKNTQDQKTISINSKILKALIDASAAFIGDWLAPKYFFEYNLPDIWLTLLHEEDYKLDACACLSSFFETFWKPKKPEITEQMATFLSKLCENTKTILSGVNQDNLEDDYDFHKQLAKVYVTFSEGKMEYITIPRYAEIMDNFLTIVLEFCKHPSLIIFDDIVNVWNVILGKKSQVINTPYVQKYYLPLLQLIRVKMNKEIGNPDVERFENNPTHILGCIDFEDKKDYYRVHGCARANMRTLVTTIATFIPVEALQYATQEVESVLKLRAPPQGDDINPLGYCTVFSDTYIVWESATTLYEWISESIKESKDEIVNYEGYLLNLLLQFSTDDPLIQTRYIHIFKLIPHLVNVNDESLLAISSALFKHMQFRPSKETGRKPEDLTEDTTAARKKVYTTFIAFCRAHAAKLPNYLKQFVDESEKLWAKHEIVNSELTHLYEAFVVISNQWKNYNQQKQFLDYLLSPLLNEWNSNPFKEVLGSVPLLFKAIGIVGEPNQEMKSKLEEIKEKIFHVLNTITSLSDSMPSNTKDMDPQCKSYPISSFILEALPNVLSLIRTLHMCYTAEGQQLIPSQVRKYILHIGLDELYLAKNEQFIVSKATPEEVAVYRVYLYLKNIRKLSYKLLGQACKYCDPDLFWNNPQLFPMLSESIFSFLEFISIKDLHLMVTDFFSMFFNHCPLDKHSKLLVEVMKPLYSMLSARVSQAWQEVMEKSLNRNAATNQEELYDEIVKEKYVRELTTDVLAIPYNATECLKPTKNNLKPSPDATASFLLNSPDVLGVILMFSCKMMTVADPVINQKAIEIAQRSLLYINAKTYEKLYAAEMFYSLLTSVMTSADEIIHAFATSLLAVIYKMYRNTGVPKQILSQVPTLTQQVVNNFDESFFKTKDDKEKRNKLKKLLASVYGMNSGKFMKQKSLLAHDPNAVSSQNVDMSTTDETTTNEKGGKKKNKKGGKKGGKNKNKNNNKPNKPVQRSFLDEMTIQNLQNLFK